MKPTREMTETRTLKSDDPACAGVLFLFLPQLYPFLLYLNLP